MWSVIATLKKLPQKSQINVKNVLKNFCDVIQTQLLPLVTSHIAHFLNVLFEVSQNWLIPSRRLSFDRSERAPIAVGQEEEKEVDAVGSDTDDAQVFENGVQDEGQVDGHEARQEKREKLKGGDESAKN